VLLSPDTAARLERLVRLARRAPAARRRPALRRVARGIEPGGRRDYVAGDDVRQLDWAAYARLERLLVRVTEALPEPRLELLLDGSASMAAGDPAPVERAALAAAALAATALAREARVTIWWAGAPPARLRLERPGQLVALLRFLARLRAGGAGGLERLAERIVQTARVRGAAVVVTDGLDPADAAAAAGRLRTGGFEALVVPVLPAAELAEPAAAAACEAGRVELVDAETGRRRTAPFARRSLDLARDRRADRIRELARRLAARGIPREELPAEAPFEAVALALLRRG